MSSVKSRKRKRHRTETAHAKPETKRRPNTAVTQVDPQRYEPKLGRSVSQFALRLLDAATAATGAAGGAGRNVVVSPWSIARALAAVWLGAGGGTRAELGQAVFGLGSTCDQASGDVTAMVSGALAGCAERYVRTGMVNEANGLWTLCALREAYVAQVAQTLRGCRIESVSGPTLDAARINQWAAEATHGLIREALPASVQLTPMDKCVLVNAVHFVGRWQQPFDKDNTTKAPFRVPTLASSASSSHSTCSSSSSHSSRHGKTERSVKQQQQHVQCDMMSGTWRDVSWIQGQHDHEWRAVCLPYVTGRRPGSADDEDSGSSSSSSSDDDDDKSSVAAQLVAIIVIPGLRDPRTVDPIGDVSDWPLSALCTRLTTKKPSSSGSSSSSASAPKWPLLDGRLPLSGGKLHVYLPRCELTSTATDVRELLQRPPFLVRTVFGTGADLSAVSSADNLYVSRVLHSATLRIDEQGTEAAATTAVVMRSKCKAAPVPTFKVDRPFVFAIIDVHTTLPLFVATINRVA